MTVQTARRALLAVVVAAAALLQVAAFATHPPLGETPTETLRLVAGDPDQWAFSHMLAGGSAALSVLSAVVLCALVRRRGAVLATAGAVLAVVGGGLLALAFGAEAHLLPLAADPSLDPAAMSALAEIEDSGPLMAMLGFGLPLSGIGSLLLAGGLLRSGAVPRWKPSLVLLGTVASIAAPPASALAPVLLAPATLGLLALAVDVARGPRPASTPPEAVAPSRVEEAVATV